MGCYQRLRRRLVEDLGVDPTPQLRELHQAVLRDEDPRPAPVPPGAPATPRPAAPPPATRPQAVPRDMLDFTGRADVLRELLATLPQADSTSTAPVIYAIDGTPGVGKTALAARH